LSLTSAIILKGFYMQSAFQLTCLPKRTNTPLILAPRKNYVRGFTLIEILIVVGIIAFLATLTAVSIMGRKRDIDRTNAQSGVRYVAGQAQQYFLDTGRVPDSMAAFMSNPAAVANWKGPYLKPSQALDPWKNAYVLRAPGQFGEVDVYSLGEDGQEGGVKYAADIGDWQ
jgi:general secretion pathway protein G